MSTEAAAASDVQKSLCVSADSPGSAWPVGSNDGDGNVIQQDWKNSGPSEDDGISRRRRRRFREGGGDIEKRGK